MYVFTTYVDRNFKVRKFLELEDRDVINIFVTSKGGFKFSKFCYLKHLPRFPVMISRILNDSSFKLMLPKILKYANGPKHIKVKDIDHNIMQTAATRFHPR